MGFGTGMAVWMRRTDNKDFESVLKASILNSSDQVLGLLCAYNSRVGTYPGAAVTGATTPKSPDPESGSS